MPLYQSSVLKKHLFVQTLQHQIPYTNVEIDQLVYELYGLTDDEIKIVEGSV